MNLLILIILLVGLCFVLIKTLHTRKKHSSNFSKANNKGRPLINLSTPLSTKNIQDFSDLKSQLDELAKKAWTTKAAFRYSDFSLNLTKFSDVERPEKVIKILLRHAEKVAPGFYIPSMIPKVSVESMAFAAGRFEVDEEGWVTIKLSQNFFQDRLAARAIIAHEVCHYILENSGIRHSNFELNERYTDLCMFICGFGEIFLAGYKQESARYEYRLGHRLGYLSDAEYQFASQYVKSLRQSDTLEPPDELEALKTRLGSLLYGDSNAQIRLIQAERRRSPHKSEEELYQDAIDRLERDRGR